MYNALLTMSEAFTTCLAFALFLLWNERRATRAAQRRMDAARREAGMELNPDAPPLISEWDEREREQEEWDRRNHVVRD